MRNKYKVLLSLLVVLSFLFCVSSLSIASSSSKKNTSSKSQVSNKKSSSTANKSSEVKKTTKKVKKITKKTTNKASKSFTGTVNINKASKEELMQLPGIGKSKAEEIIKTRKKMGKFKSADDLLKVNGIGEKTLKGMKKNLKF